MNIIIRNTDGVVIFDGLDLSLDSSGAHGTGWTYSGVNSSSATLVQNVTLPIPWVASAYSYVNGTWTVVKQTAVNAAQQSINSQLAQITYNNLLASGINLISTGTTSLNGNYSISTMAQHNISGIMSGIANGLGLPGGGTTFNYIDSLGGFHAFDASHITALASAVRDFIYKCDIALATIQSGATATFPNNSITIP